jgi:tetratricopeptide (TPR) repeat protein
MKLPALLPAGALCVAFALFSLGLNPARAQVASEVSAAKTIPPEELSQAELLKSYLQVREQLHAAQLAIVNNRIEAESNARVQAAALAEKLEGIKAAINAERERQQADVRRLEAERERQQAEAQRSNRTVLWIASAFGGVGLIAILAAALFQWRTVNRMADVVAQRPALADSSRQGLLAAEAAADQTVAVSNQRMMSVIERIEKRIYELEHTAQPPAVAIVTPVEPDSVRRPATPDRSSQIAMLLAKARSMMAADKPREAMACYNEILRIDLNHPEALVRKGVALERLKQDDEAIQCYDHAIKSDRRMTLAYLHKGGICNRLQRYEEALDCYEQALRAEEEGKQAGRVVLTEDWPTGRS